jgi:hypothetical protein
MVYIKISSILLTFIGTVFTLLGLIPYIVQFPNSDPTASGPKNLWEVLIYLAYDGKGWYLAIGVILLFLGLFLNKKVIV